ncbi:MAG: glucosaminidase domain-containing protein [Bacteroidota bacterium]
MEQLKIDLARVLKSFLIGLTFALCVMLGLNANHFYDPEPILELPIIQELNDTYAVSWATLFENSLSAPTSTTFSRWNFGKKKERLNAQWNRHAILDKLKSYDFPKSKLKSAERYLDYIEANKDIAMQDMEDSGVFASIKIAQGLLESAAGSSKLARATNNHFGIKARANKIGRLKLKNRQFSRLTDEDYVPIYPATGVHRMTDDHYHDRFESYRTVEDSYARHTQLLTKNCTLGKVGCYDWIWEYFPVGKVNCDIKPAAQSFYSFSRLTPDYFFDGATQVPYFMAAASGLKMAGYATSKTYHRKLSYIIVTYELWQFDLVVKRRREQHISRSSD